MQYIKQSTSTNVIVGPFVDETDGVTPVTGITFTGTDVCGYINLAGSFTDLKSASWNAVSGASGWYYTALTLTGTGYYRLVVHDADGFLPVIHDIISLPANVYDSLYTNADKLQVDVTELLGDASGGTNIKNFFTGTGYNASASTIGTANTIGATGLAAVNSQVVDVMKVDTITPLTAQTAPPAAPTMEQILTYLYTELRNKVVVDSNTANEKQVFADDGVTMLYRKGITDITNVTTVNEATAGV